MKQASQPPSNLLENLRKVISLVDQLRDIGLQEYIKLPRIVVLGIQSSGKSSLLEQIVGIDFLPRGDGVVTRRPLELRLSYVAKSKCPEPYAIFEELKGQKFTDFSKVKENIISLTDKIAGTSKNIVDNPIILQVYGPSCPDLTLVDLPGITRIPIAGQSDNIEEVTKNMAKKYCEDPKTIILCVVAANQDLSTSDALLMARQLDPKGDRTFGVLTKIDIMDRGTNALNMLKGKDVGLKYGYVGVKLRSQQDIKENLTVQKAIQQEREFFANHPVYSSVPGDYFGTQVLTNKLTSLLYRHIRSFLPELMKEINKRVSDIEQRLGKLGPGLPVDDKDKLHYIWQLINEFTIRFKNSISGSYEKSAMSNKMMIPPAGARIRRQFADFLKDEERQDFEALKSYKDTEIQQIIYKYEGDNIPGFLSVDAFYALLNPELRKLNRPSQECVEETYAILEEYANNILNAQLEKLPAVKDLLQEQVLNVIQSSKAESLDAVQDLLESELNYIFTNDIGFLIGQPYFGVEKQQETKQGQNPLVAELRKKIEHYYKLVIRTVRDNVPKLVGHFLVKGCQNTMLLSLQENLMQNQEYLEIINEPAHLAEERKNLKKEIETLKNAQKVVKRDPEYIKYHNIILSLADYILRLANDEEGGDNNEQQEKKQKRQESPLREEEKSQQIQDTQIIQNTLNTQNKQTAKSDNRLDVQQTNPPVSDNKQVKTSNLFPPNIVRKTESPVNQPYEKPIMENKNAPSPQPEKGQQGPLNAKQPQIQPQQQQQQQTQKANPLNNPGNKPKTFKDQYDSTVDSAVDKAMSDPKVKDAIKKQAGQAAGQAVAQNMPGAPGWVQKGVENVASNAAGSDVVQGAIKDNVKAQLKDPLPAEPQAQQKSLFGFLQPKKS